MSGSQQVAENLVIGGGPAGSMLAMRLAAAGLKVTLLEKERVAHHKVCGEFLSREAVGYLRQAGIEPRELGATAIRTVRLTAGRRTATSTLPFEALSLSRYILDAAILAQAHYKGCEVRSGVFVETLKKQGDAWLVRLRNGQSISAREVFLANGKHDLRGWERAGGKQCDLVGFKMHWRLSPSSTRALREVMDLFLFDGGYGGLSLIENDVANLCLVVRRSKLRKIGGWERLFAGLLCENPHMLQRMQGAEAMWERPLAISSIPYGYLAQRPGGVWCVGDQAAVIPSFTGDGMSIALHSGALAAEMYLAGNSAEEYHSRLHTQLERSMSLAAILSRAMVTRAGRSFAPLILALFPNAMRWIAASTRIPEPALHHGTDDPGGETTLRKSQIA